jgi:hypothetical protein
MLLLLVKEGEDISPSSTVGESGATWRLRAEVTGEEAGILIMREW